MDKLWIEKARKYIEEHNAFIDVSEILTHEETATIFASVKVGLPSKYIKAGMTPLGVKNKEEVKFVFCEQFPLVAPRVYLRDDFPRCFPHINPSDSSVSPCIYEGNSSELLQQTEWMNGILNQLVDWLEKAASNDLINFDQGWEPMRNDSPSGFMLYDLEEVVDAFRQKQSSCLSKEVYYNEVNSLFLVNSGYKSQQCIESHILYFLSPRIIDNYMPNSITTISQLYEYANSIGICDFKAELEVFDARHINEDKLFVVLLVQRPAKIIGSNSKIEFLNFVVYKSDHRMKKRRELKRILPDCKVGMLLHISEKSPTLLKQLSGTNIKNNSKNIVLIGCGSLGSKIGIHLARNGNEPFLCIDNDLFMPHNNARHGLTFALMENKAKLLSQSMESIGRINAKAEIKSALNANYSNSRIIIDTTASLSVRNFLMARIDLPPVISCGLYEQGQFGLMLLENRSKKSTLADIWAYLYFMTLTNHILSRALFYSNVNNVRIGQSCSSQTMVVDDAKISLMAATMSLKIQATLSEGTAENGEIFFVRYDNNYSTITESLVVPEYIKVNSIIKRDWEVYLSKSTYDEMKELLHDKSPKETGGVLIGSVFSFAKLVVVTGIIPAPPDSTEDINRFILGTEGLEDSVKKLEKKTNGKVTYLGTWHSHPQGGSASGTDDNTYKKLLFVRNYEPTICLIITKDEVILV